MSHLLSLLWFQADNVIWFSFVAMLRIEGWSKFVKKSKSSAILLEKIGKDRILLSFHICIELLMCR